jgi:hypothetical protein
VGVSTVAIPHRRWDEFFLGKVTGRASRKDQVLDAGCVLDHSQLDFGCRFDSVFPQDCLRIGHEAGLELRIRPGPSHNLPPLLLLESFLFGHGLSLSE